MDSWIPFHTYHFIILEISPAFSQLNKSIKKVERCKPQGRVFWAILEKWRNESKGRSSFNSSTFNYFPFQDTSPWFKKQTGLKLY